MSRRARKRFSFLKVIIGATGVLLVCFAWIYFTLPDVRVLKSSYPVVKYQGPKLPPSISFKKGRPRSWVSLGEVSKVAVGAIIVSEDWAFYQHNGYDLNQIKEAAREDWEERKFARGASTITQQVVRNVFLTKDKNLWRKAKEFYLAIRLDQLVGKRRTLETYLNIAEWGPAIFGIRAASHYYFSKEPGALTAKEGAFLAMLLPSPVRYGQSFRKKCLTAYAEETIDSILVKMTQARYITEDQRIMELNAPLPFEETLALPAPGASPEPRPTEEAPMDGERI
jgi:monofunctional biosynthetic peptidoglycan transglycosylase